MGVKSNDKITKIIIDTLLSNIITLYKNRGLTVNNQNLANIGNSYTQTIAQNAIIQMSDLGDILNKVIVVNDIDSLKYASKKNNYSFGMNCSILF